MNNTTLKILIAILLMVIFSGCQTPTLANNGYSVSPRDAQFADGNVKAKRIYEKGQKAMDKGNWRAAGAAFAELAKTDPENADLALYWQSYALFRGGKSSSAIKTLRMLFAEHPDSRWVSEGKALQAEITGNTELSENDEMKLIALQSLMHTNSERVIPLIKKTLESDSSAKVKETAMFILSQKRSKEARALLVDYARSSQDPVLQQKAIEILGMSGDKESRAMLASMYSEINNSDVKRSILNGLMMARDETRLLAIAKQETDTDLQRQAIEMLGVIRSKGLQELYTKDASANIKEAVINGLMVSRDDEGIIKIIEQETDPEVAVKAIQMLGVIRSTKGSTVLGNLWTDKDAPIAIKEAILEAWMIGRDYDSLKQAAKATTDPELREKTIEMLGVTRQRETLREMYKQEQDMVMREKLMEALMIAGDREILGNILETETDPEILKQAIQMSISFGGKETREKLNVLYRKTTNNDIKEAIIETHMASRNVDQLIALLDAEADPQLRYKVIEMLAVSRSDKAAATLNAEYKRSDDLKVKNKILEAYMIMGNARQLVEIFRTETNPELKRNAVRYLSTMRSKEAQELMLELLEQS